MKVDDPIVYVVDDDEAMSSAIESLLQSVSLPTRCFASATEFLEAYKPGVPGCVVLDVRLPGMSGLDLQDVMAERGETLPLIFITGHGDIPMTTRAMVGGAFQFIQKPFNNQTFLEYVHHAVAKSVEDLRSAQRRQAVLDRVGSLTDRENEILRLLVEGAPNKVMAKTLGISERTVEVHRAHVMEKMQVRSVAELIREIVENGVKF